MNRGEKMLNILKNMENKQQSQTAINKSLDDLQKNLIDTHFKMEMRKQALQVAEHLQPPNYHTDLTQLGKQSGNNKSVNTLLKDADSIYEWLTKDI